MDSVFRKFRVALFAVGIALCAFTIAIGISTQPAIADEGDLAPGMVASADKICTITFVTDCGAKVDKLQVKAGTKLLSHGFVSSQYDRNLYKSIAFSTTKVDPREPDYIMTDLTITVPNGFNSQRKFWFWSTTPNRLEQTAKVAADGSWGPDQAMDHLPESYTVNSDLTLYAAWYNLDYNTSPSTGKWQYFANGGTGSMANPDVSKMILTPSECKFTRPGYTFVRWSTMPDGTGASYLPGKTYGTTSWMQPLYAIWKSDSPEGSMFRLYNPNSGEHFYTASANERDGLVKAGWRYEGIGWTAPATSKTPVYRLYSGTDHHYTTSAKEKDGLVKVGWKYEGIGWYSDDAKGTPLYRQFNPNVNPKAKRNNSGSHNYTTSKKENDSLVKLGWRAEGVGWYGL